MNGKLRILALALILCSSFATRGYLSNSASAQDTGGEPSTTYVLGDPSAALNDNGASASSVLETSCYGGASAFKSGSAIAGWGVLDCVGSYSMYIEIALYACGWGGTDYCGDMSFQGDMGPECAGFSGTLYCPTDGGLYFQDVYPEGCFMVVAYIEVNGDEGWDDGSADSAIVCY